MYKQSFLNLQIHNFSETILYEKQKENKEKKRKKKEPKKKENKRK